VLDGFEVLIEMGGREPLALTAEIHRLGALARGPHAAVEGVLVAVRVTMTLIGIEAGAAKILIDTFLSYNPSWDNGANGNGAGEDSTQGGGR
jgi:hypothetical protein